MRAIDADNVLLRITSEKEDNWKSCKGKPNEYDIGVNNGLTLAHAIVLGTPTIELPRWIPVTERLPDAEQTVQLFCCDKEYKKHRYTCVGFYVPHGLLKGDSDFDWDFECCEDYDEEHDDYIVNAGWYETIHNWGDYSACFIYDEVTHWMPLPTPPKDGE